MFSVSVSRSLSARHFFEGAHGKEGMVHSHLYKIEISVSGVALDENGFLLDMGIWNIDGITLCSNLVAHFLISWTDARPSLRRELMRLYLNDIHRRDARYKAPFHLVRTWESEEASATYERDL